MATMDKMLAAAPLSEGDVEAMVILEPFEVAMIGYAAKKKVLLVSSVVVDKIWTITINGFNTSRFYLDKNTIEIYMATVMEMVNIVAAKPNFKRKTSRPKPKHMGDCKPLKLGEMSRLCEKRLQHLPYFGIWDTGHPGVQVGAKVIRHAVINGKSVAILEEGYFLNGQHFKNYGLACAVADYYREYVGGDL